VRLRILAATVLLLALAAPAAASGGLPVRYTIPGEAVFPEGIVAGRGGDFYVSATADGTIFRGNVADPELEVFAPPTATRTTAVGLEFDRRGRLWVAGGASGRLTVLDGRTGEELASYDLSEFGAGFVNDVVATPQGVYATDSFAPQLYRVPFAGGELGDAEVFVDFTGTPFAYVEGAFNANGIEAGPAGGALVVVQSVTGRLWRIDTRTRAVTEVDLGDGEPLVFGDGLQREGRDLYVVQNQLERVTRVRLSAGLRAGEVQASVTDDLLRFPTTVERIGDRLYLVNSQFDRRGATPDLPFDVVAIPRF